MKKTIKVIGIIIAAIIIVILCSFAIYCYNNLHWMDQYENCLRKVGAVEKQITLPNGNVINYGEIGEDGPALLLIHGQMGTWQCYAPIFPKLAKNWHIYAIDLYGHGKSSHDPEHYYIDENGNDIIWFIDNVIGEETVVVGHSNGAILTAYIAANGGKNIAGVVLEDPPIFSTQGENWENNFSYLDTYQVIHNYNNSDHSECWPAYYFRHCYWGQLFMPEAMEGIADYAQNYSEKHPGKEVKIFFLPKMITGVFPYIDQYDFAYGEKFYDTSWNHGLKQEDILAGVEVPCIYLHAKENRAEDGMALCAATREQAERAAGYIGDNCKIIETTTSDHTIHSVHPKVYIDAINSFLKK